MKLGKLMQLNLCGTVTHRAEAAAYLKRPGDSVIIERGILRALILACPCGCTENFPINLDNRVGKAWTFYKTKDIGAISIYPSIWRDDGCESHYIIWRNEIYLFGQSDDEFENDNLSTLTNVIELVFDQLQNDRYRSYTDISEDLDLIPWDVLWVCKKLVKNNRAIEGQKGQRGSFKRR
jgi:hypothetical protein